MAEAFDPYSQLLGIPAIDQPPNHYRLLGVTLFEPERATIDAAARRLMAQLQRNAGGADPAAIRRLLGEISNARVCLLTPEKRAVYDEKLHADLEAAEVHDVIVEAVDEPELTGSGVGHGGDAREAGAGQGGGAARPATPAKSARPAASGGQGGGFFADLGIGSGIWSSARGSANTKPAAAQSPAAGMNLSKPAAGKPAASKPAAGGKSAAAWSGGGTGKAKPASGAFGKPGTGGKPPGWKPQPWQIAAAGGGVVLLAIAVFAFIAMNGGEDDNRQAKSDHKAEAPRFGPASVTGPIDDVTTRSPLGTRPSTRVAAERHGDLLLANVKINGTDAGKFLLDTGCTDVVISPALAEQLKLQEVGQTSLQAPGGKLHATKRRIKSLTLGDAKFEDSNMLPERKDNWNILAADMKPWQDAVGVPIAGVIGCDIWYQMPVQWDVNDKSVTLFNRHQNVVTQSAHAAFMTLINAAASVGQPCASASLDHAKEEDYWLLATGATTDLLVKTGKGGAATDKVGTLSVFGQDFPNPKSAALMTDSAYFADDARQRGVIGSHILANFVLVLDFQNNKYLAQRNGAK